MDIFIHPSVNKMKTIYAVQLYLKILSANKQQALKWRCSWTCKFCPIESSVSKLYLKGLNWGMLTKSVMMTEGLENEFTVAGTLQSDKRLMQKELRRIYVWIEIHLLKYNISIKYENFIQSILIISISCISYFSSAVIKTPWLS